MCPLPQVRGRGLQGKGCRVRPESGAWPLESPSSPSLLPLCPQEAGRLLYIGQNEWTHVNCAIWSAEVFEENDGSLKNVHAAVARGRQMVRGGPCSCGAALTSPSPPGRVLYCWPWVQFSVVPGLRPSSDAAGFVLCMPFGRIWA